MVMYNPPHPGEFIQATYMLPFNLCCRFLAGRLGVATSTLSRILKMQSGISPEMALRLSKVLGRSPESWLSMQSAYDLWHTRKNITLEEIHELKLEIA
jgi:antitoxin HigA-1